MASNGLLSASDLKAIPGGRLRRDAAWAWNAMNAESERRGWGTLRPLGAMSSYRTLAQQKYLWNLYVSGRGNLAARPGTSNHGWGLAVDCASQHVRWVVDQIGAKYGFAKRWSDAPGEWWHIRWRAGSYPAVTAYRKAHTHRVLRRGMSGSDVGKVQSRLAHLGWHSVPSKGEKGHGYFGDATVRAVKRFQAKHNLKPDGIVGAGTWAKLF